MDHLPTLLLALDALVAAFGVAIASLAVAAFRRTGSPGLRLVAFGVATVAAGTVLPDVAYVAAGVEPVPSLLLGTVVATVGFAVLSYSLYAEYDDARALPRAE